MPSAHSSEPDAFVIPPSRGSAVLHRLRHEILTRSLEPGAPIRDAELAERLGVSITPVREAVVALVAEGLIEVLPNKRRRVTVMTERRAEELMDVLSIILVGAMERLDPHSEAALAVSRAAARFAEVVPSDDRDGAEQAFGAFVQSLLDGAGSDELKRMAGPMVVRAVSMIRLYDADDLVHVWGEEFREISVELASGSADGPRLLREFFWRLLSTMESRGMRHGSSRHID
ncbi:GntR family transcriptional regulator [Microbacterium sp. A93]|uniref:GntR family transcriptional regulator n=1 Tax=Microbacterium sp. A93 TaxID=3450716 RepID=UPI003F43A21D